MPHFTFLPENSGPTGRQFKPKMGSGRGQTQNFSSTGSIGRKVVAPNPPLSASQNQNRAPGGAKTKTVRPLGRKVVTLNPPLNASRGAQRGVGVTTFRPNGPPERLTALIGGLLGPMGPLF